VFQVEIGSVSSKEAFSGVLKKEMNLPKYNHLCWKQEHLEHFFLVNIELVFERNTSCKS
jgi:hypothetical protein